MTIDKSWTKVKNRLSDEFTIGLSAFIERCKDHLSRDGQCRCPCEKCDNHRWGTLDDLYSHIHRWGFSEAYKTWSYHGEQLDVPVVYDVTDKMVDVLNDVHSENTDNKHNTKIDETNEPTEGPSATNDETDKLALAETELYPGCTSMSSLDFLAKMSHVKVTNNWTDSSFDQLLELLKYSFPKDNKIPSSHREAKKMMKKSG